MIDTVFFDLDGTITDPSKGITRSVSYALEKMGIVESDYDNLCRFIGPPLFDAFAEYYNFSKEESSLAVKYFREYFTPRGIYENILYPDIYSLLDHLYNKSFRLVITTSKPQLFAKQIIEYFELTHFFELIIGSTMDETFCNKGDIIEYALNQCEVNDLSKVIMIGDRKYDIIGANQNGIKSIGVLYGFGTELELQQAGATWMANTVFDIEKIIDDHNSF